MAADNVLPEKEWLKKMTMPFIENSEIVGAFCKVITASRDNKFNKYFNSDTDPFNAFIYGCASHPDKFHKLYRMLKKGNNYTVYNYSLSEFPLLALAQGFILKRSFYRNPESDYYDILPILDLIKQKKKIAYVTNTGIYHYSLKGFRDFLKKYNKRSQNALKHGFRKRRKFLSGKRKIKQYLWFPYSLSVIFPLLAAFRNFFRKKKLYYFYHPIACFSLAIIIIRNFLKESIRKNAV